MRFIITAVLFLWPFLAFPYSTQVESTGPGEFRISVDIKPSELQLVPVFEGGRRYLRIESGEGLGLTGPGMPDLPRMHRWLAADPRATYTIESSFEEPILYNRVLLHPVQPDVADTGVTAPFVIDAASYSRDTWFGAEGATLGRKAGLGGVTVLPLRILPLRYNPAKRKLQLFRRIRIRISTASRDAAFFPRGELPTRFTRDQIGALVLNGGALLHALPPATDPKRYLILSSHELMPVAKELGALYPAAAAKVEYAEVEAGAGDEQVKQLLSAHYRSRGGLDAALFFGDRDAVPLHYWSSGLPGDSWYSFLDGDDFIADIALGRLPASNEAEARLIVTKIKKYKELQAAGQKNKNILLVAHKQEYPGKYTANQEKIKNADNPKGFQFSTLYGGEGATSSDVVDAVNGTRESGAVNGAQGMGIVNYRGHGSNTTWSGWGGDGKSFGASDVDNLTAEAAKMAVYFDIACLNGAIHKPTRSLVQKQLFASDEAGSYQGAVGAIAATIESGTEVNHRFDINLFKFLGELPDISLGNIYAAANNQLVKDNGGEAVGNVKMYILFADPLLAPWVE